MKSNLPGAVSEVGGPTASRIKCGVVWQETQTTSTLAAP
jgi:hypothetical protein